MLPLSEFIGQIINTSAFFYRHVDDISVVYRKFLDCIKMLVNDCIPSKTVKIGPRDPSYITPVVKLLLEKRRRLRHKGHLEEAGRIADRIDVMISKHRESCLEKLADGTPKELWATVNKQKHSEVNAVAINGIALNPDVLNTFPV